MRQIYYASFGNQCISILEFNAVTLRREEELVERQINTSSRNVTFFLQAADLLERASSQMIEIEISYQQLRNYQQRFVDLYLNRSQALSDIANATKEEEIDKGFDDFGQAHRESRQLLEELVRYCESQDNQAALSEMQKSIISIDIEGRQFVSAS